MSRAKKPKVQRRTVVVSISAPVCVTITVERDASDPDDLGEWRIASVRRAECDISPRGVEERMTDEDLAELDRIANAAQDDQ